ncbi:MAG: hypothetical protein QGG36_27330 [Pirellulaceae bacterium]|jgi:hypothetical protein|nr:hypothetical protein [Pirellulaceae bacterium]MDP7019540.1 hypothetical protein [Pirellulaceae bacterium]
MSIHHCALIVCGVIAITGCSSPDPPVVADPPPQAGDPEPSEPIAPSEESGVGDAVVSDSANESPGDVDEPKLGGVLGSLSRAISRGATEALRQPPADEENSIGESDEKDGEEKSADNAGEDSAADSNDAIDPPADP